jgi:hypothetical protein
MGKYNRNILKQMTLLNPEIILKKKDSMLQMNTLDRIRSFGGGGSGQ